MELIVHRNPNLAGPYNQFRFLHEQGRCCYFICFFKGFAFFVIHILVAVIIGIVLDVAAFFERGFLCRMHFQCDGLAIKFCAVMLAVGHKLKGCRMITGFRLAVFDFRFTREVQGDVLFGCRFLCFFIFEQGTAGSADIVGNVAIGFLGGGDIRNGRQVV